MLEGLDKINWHEVKHAYGPATNIPDLIRQLTTKDPVVWDRAWEFLHNDINHQDSIYPATPVVIPFLIELLTYETIINKEEILDFIRWLQIYKQNGEIGGKIFESIYSGLKVYTQLLEAGTSQIKKQAACILSTFSEDAFELAPLLFTAFEVEESMEEKAEILVSVGILASSNKSFLEKHKSLYKDLITVHTHSKYLPIKLAASIALVLLLKEETPEEIIQIVIEANIYPKKYAGRGIWYVGNPEILKELGISKGVRALISVFSESKETFKIHELQKRLLDLAFMGNHAKITSKSFSPTPDNLYEIKYNFSNKDILTVDTLTEEQRLALTAILNHDIVWEIPSNLMELYGLPRSREGLREFLAYRAVQLSFDLTE